MEAKLYFWKGRLSETDVATINKGLEEARKEGRKEVMEWVNHNDICGEFSHVNMHYRSAWCAQLKTWGLEEPCLEKQEKNT